ncbi:hypothetical protein ACLKA6_018809 [Drosophila palustris]
MEDDKKSDAADQLLELLKQFQLEEAYEYLMDAQVTYESLEYMQKDDIKEAIPPLGLRMQFREKLFNWKKQMGVYLAQAALQFGIDDETISTMPTCSSSTQQKVSNWLEDESFNGRRVLNKSLLSVFKQTSEGSNWQLQHRPQTKTCKTT